MGIPSVKDRLGSRCTGCSVTNVSCGIICSVLGSNLTMSRRTKISAAGIANNLEERAARRRVEVIWTRTRTLESVHSPKVYSLEVHSLETHILMSILTSCRLEKLMYN